MQKRTRRRNDIHQLPFNPVAELENLKARSRPVHATPQQKPCDVSVNTQCLVYRLKHQPTGDLTFMRVSGVRACMLRAHKASTRNA